MCTSRNLMTTTYVMDSIVVAIVGLLKCTAPSIAERWKHHRGLKENMNMLNQRREELNSRKRDIELEKETELVPGKTTLKNKVQLWLERVRQVNNDVNSIEENFKAIKYFSRAGLGRRVVEKIREVKELHENGEFSNGLATIVIKLQDAIASKLNLDISQYNDEETRAAKLFAELIRNKKYVLVLDDILEDYRLEDVGVPETTLQNRCKLVLTTRSLDVCHRISCKPVQMEHLSEEEAFNLFLNIVGRDVSSIPDLKVIIELVVKECACLPLAIVTIAGSMIGIIDPYEWKTTLRDLQSSTKGPDEIFDKLKFSYDRLKDETLKACLQYCALFPEDYEIDRVMFIEYLTAEGIITEKTRRSEVERGQSMLNKLVRACLLEETRYQGCIKMHDLIRDMVLQIVRVNPRYLVEAGMRLKSVPDEEDWKIDLARVSLLDNNISDIPSSFESPKCPTLSTLLLKENPNLRCISDNFFFHMERLTVLDLSYTGIKNLPESVSELVNLIALLLRGCKKLHRVPSLAKLRGLRKLDFYDTRINQVPQGMEMLVRLRYLNFSRTPLELLPEEILCSLTNLQYLLVVGEQGPRISGEELANLKRLETFHGQLYDINNFNAFVRYLEEGVPINYVLLLGFFPTTLDHLPNIDIEHNKAVHLQNCKLRQSLAEFPKDVEEIYIRKCEVNGKVEFNNATNLRILDLQGVIRRERGVASLLPPGTFSSFKDLRICNCDKVKKLFTLTNVWLPNLEEVIVSHCEQLVDIMSMTSDDEKEDQIEEARDQHRAINVINLSKLRKLHLSWLPELQSIPVIADSLQSLDIFQCPKLKRIPLLD
ncbi:hypothetical protein TIFTF001_044319 [Ficus carica]|uniref:NB-ARC domain-containing protein n=1 Tax=Ficus carica TaxID=3494 RepID=A0AA87ZM45_FICCA|nr:hypothetical protein TIFTF001_044319 [Ficus carica]